MSELRSKIDTMFLFFGNECFDTTEGKDIDLKKSAKEKTDFILKAVYKDLICESFFQYNGKDKKPKIILVDIIEWAKENNID